MLVNVRLVLCPTRHKTVGLKHDGTDGTAYTDETAGLVADGTDYKDVYVCSVELTFDYRPYL